MPLFLPANYEQEFNVQNYGILNDGVTDNLAAINLLLSTTAPDAATIYFPAGTYRVSGAISVPSGRHYRIKGAGMNKTFIQTTSATLDTITFNDWQQEIEDISFSSSVTKTAGIALNFQANNSVVARRCQFTGMWTAIAHAGTIGWFEDCIFNNGKNNSILLNGANVNDSILNCTFDCSPAIPAHINVVQCGSVVIDNCDIIHATNNLLINPTANGAFAIYCANTFFDSAAGSSVKLIGSTATGNIQRVKFENCWFNSTVSNGFECAGTATTLPTAIDFVNCDFFSNPTTGLLMSAVQDFSIVGSRIAGSTTGVNIAASASAVTKFVITGNTIGPTAGIGANTTGINIQSGTYGQYSIQNNNLTGNTTNLADAGLVTTQGQKIVQNNLGVRLLGGVGNSLIAASSAINTTETILVGGLSSLPIPANALAVGSNIRVTLIGTCTSTAANASTFRVRFGTAGTTADTAILTGAVTAVTSGTTVGFKAVIEFTVRTLGASATFAGSLTVLNSGTTGIQANNSNVIPLTAAAGNTTVANYLSVSYVSAATTTTSTFQNAIVEFLN